MVIRLEISELLFDIQNKSYMDCQKIADPVERYRTEAGTDKKDEVGRCITKAISELELLCNQWTDTSVAENPSYNDIDLPTPHTKISYYEFNFAMGDRRASGKDKIVKNLLHDYVVRKALADYYSVSLHPEFAQNHTAISNADVILLRQTLHSKKQPSL